MLRYKVENRKDYENLMDYFEKMNYKWNAGQQPRQYDRKNENYPRIYGLTEDGLFGCGSSIISGVLEPIPGSYLIKSKYIKDFKKMFRLNSIPLTITDAQMEQMSKENVLALWKV